MGSVATARIIGELLREAPLLPAETTCAAVAELLSQNADMHLLAVALSPSPLSSPSSSSGRPPSFGLVDRALFLPRYLDRFNRDIFQRRPISHLIDPDPLVVAYDAPIELIGLQVTSQRPEVLKTGFIITRGGDYVGVGTGVELMHAVSLRADEANVAKSTFLANMSHEIRTPLNAVIGNLELLSLSGLDEMQCQLANDSSVAAHMLLDIIGDLLDLSKIQADRFDIERLDVNLRQVLDDALTLIAPRAAQKGLRLVALVSDSVPATVIADPIRLRQVLVNFLGNAVKFTQEGGIFVTVRGERPDEIPATRDDPTRPMLRIEVTDTGPGFDPDRAEALFEPFVQEDLSTTRRFGGTGLGLAISRRIVELLGGEIGCSAVVGLGACFWCAIPLPKEGSNSVVSSQDGEFGGTPILLVGRETGRIAVNLARQGLKVATRTLENAPSPTADILVVHDEGRRSLESLGRWGGGGCAALVFLTDDLRPAIRFTAYRLGATHVASPAEALDVLGQLARAPVRRDSLELYGLRRGAGRQVGQPIPVDLARRAEAPILVMDDTATNRELAHRQLARLGLACETAENGLVGLELASQRDYALILVDGSMPVMNGREFVARFRDLERQRRGEGAARVPVIVVTAHALAGDREQFLAAGMDDYLAKPVTLAKLRATLEKWLPAEESPPVIDQPAIDWQALAEMLGDDDPASLAEMLAVFIEDFAELLADLGDAVTGGEASIIARAAHGAKSAAASAGAVILAELLRQLEAEAASGKTGPHDEALAHLRAEFTRIEAEVAARR